MGVGGQCREFAACFTGVFWVRGVRGAAQQVQRELFGDRLLVGGERLGFESLMVGGEKFVAVEGHPDRESAVAEPVGQRGVPGILQSAGQAGKPLGLELGGGALLLGDAVHEHDRGHRSFTS